jgi:hypothetical protein
LADAVGIVEGAVVGLGVGAVGKAVGEGVGLFGKYDGANVGEAIGAGVGALEMVKENAGVM